MLMVDSGFMADGLHKLFITADLVSLEVLLPAEAEGLPDF